MAAQAITPAAPYWNQRGGNEPLAILFSSMMAVGCARLYVFRYQRRRGDAVFSKRRLQRFIPAGEWGPPDG
ncbi:hypothetical protein KCP73_11505 [Salmonella enterica subsp. enterica]|nr:hypothetical protein KCP73_11505 [Salmonella enterica subsp. enterica]